MNRSSALYFLLFLATACSSATGRTDTSADGGLSPEEMAAIYQARTDSARMRFTQADVRFITSMIGHHAQALVMASLAPTRAADPAVRTLAARVINGQQDEIATMQRWLTDRRQPVPQVHLMNGSVHVEGVDHLAAMPGMLTPQQLAELEAATGPTFDRLFLDHMIQHHAGAVRMVRELLASDGAGQDEDVFRLASNIQVDQITEIERMERMLQSLP
jgi:uncharacterized protein (DUF305 family)